MILMRLVQQIDSHRTRLPARALGLLKPWQSRRRPRPKENADSPVLFEEAARTPGLRVLIASNPEGRGSGL